MPAWSNPPLIVYHGTDSLSVPVLRAAIGSGVPFRVDLAVCRPGTDFGRGFYTTTNRHQAEQWANSRVLRAKPSPGLYGIVLAFDIDRDWLASLDTLAFARPMQGFWDLVDDCRHGFPPHGRSPPHPSSYDVVYGPVTLWPQRLSIADCDQISFHTPRSLSGLTSVALQSRAASYLF